MRKYLKLFMVALFATLTFSLTSCGDDDEPSGGDIVGTWEAVDYPMGINQIIQFASDGKYTEVNYDGDETDVLRGKWTRKGNKVTATNNDDEFGDISYEATIVKVTDTELILDLVLWKISYKKVPDATINKYLN